MKARIEDRPVFTALTVELDQGEQIKAEAGSMVAMSPTIELKAKSQGRGIGGMLKAAIGGESIFITEYTATGGAGEVTLAPSSPGDILEFDLRGETMFCKGGSFLAGDPELDISTQGSLKGILSGTGLFLQKITGNGKVFINSYGSIIEKQLGSGETLKVDTGHLLAFDSSVSYTINKAAKGIFSTLASGEGLVCTVSGPGRVWVQTRNMEAFAHRLAVYLPNKSSN